MSPHDQTAGDKRHHSRASFIGGLLGAGYFEQQQIQLWKRRSDLLLYKWTSVSLKEIVTFPHLLGHTPLLSITHPDAHVKELQTLPRGTMWMCTKSLTLGFWVPPGHLPVTGTASGDRYLSWNSKPPVRGSLISLGSGHEGDITKLLCGFSC